MFKIGESVIYTSYHYDMMQFKMYEVIFVSKTFIGVIDDYEGVRYFKNECFMGSIEFRLMKLNKLKKKIKQCSKLKNN